MSHPVPERSLVAKGNETESKGGGIKHCRQEGSPFPVPSSQLPVTSKALSAKRKASSGNHGGLSPTVEGASHHVRVMAEDGDPSLRSG